MQLSLFHDYQKMATKRMIAESELALFLDMGLGKTICTLVAIRKLINYGKVDRVLIVAPITVMYNTWMQEAEKWEYTRSLTFSILHGASKDMLSGRATDIHLINYEGLQWWTDHVRLRFKKFPYDMVVFDESSKLKSHKTKRFKQLKGLIKFFRRRYLLTATPAPNSLQELWSQYYLLDAGKTFGGSFGKYQRKYFFSPKQYIWCLQDGAEDDIRSLAAPKCIRLEAADYIKMPPITYNNIMLDLPKKLADQYLELEEEFFLEIEGEEFEVFNMAALGNKLRQFVQGGLYTPEHEWVRVHDLKLNALKDIVDTAQGNPILCAIQFRGELEVIRKIYPKAPVIAGGTDKADVRRYIQDWNAGKIPLLICHPRSLSHGVNLQSGGHTLLWYGLTWSLEESMQLNGRLHRQGQENPVIIHHLVIRNTIDMAVMQAIERKSKSQSDLLNYFKAYMKKKGIM